MEGGTEGEGGKGHTHSSAGFEAETNLRGKKKKKKVNSENGSREGEQVRGGLIRKKQKKFKPIFKDECLRSKGPRQEIRNMLNKSELKIKLRGRKFIDQQSNVFHRTSLL